MASALRPVRAIMTAVSTRTAQLRRPAPWPKVIGMCAARDAGEWASSIGAVGYIPKPFEIDQLLDELARHLQPRSGSVADAQA